MQLYLQTVAAMQVLPEPPYVTYRLVTLDGGSIHLGFLVSRHELWYTLPRGSSSGTAWSVAHRTSDSASMVIDRAGQRYVSNRSFFDPTWYGAYHSMHHGLFFLAQSNGGALQPTQRPVPTPAPTPTPNPSLRVIAVTNADSALYKVRDRGSATCPNGDPGHALEFDARGDPATYQLAAATVDTTNKLFCMIRFTDPDQWLGITDSDEEYYGELGGYWIRVGGTIIRRTDPSRIGLSILFSLGLMSPMQQQMREGAFMNTRTYNVQYQFTEIAFPQTEPDDFFVIPSGQ